MIGAARIVPSADGTYRPDPSGQWAVILPVRDREGELCDLAAWFPNQPERWWLRFGDATPLLGARALAVAAYFGDPIELFPTPEQWALAGGRGCAALNWCAPIGDLFEGVSRVECDSPALQVRLRDTLRRWEPPVTVKPSEARRAA